MPWLKQSECVGCKACVDICPVKAIYMENGKACIDQEKCIHCGKCLPICPFGAIKHNSENPDFKKTAHHGKK